MNKHTYTRSLLWTIVFIVGATGLIGCATTGMQRSERATTTMEAVKQDIDVAIRYMNAADSSLNVLINRNQADVKEAFNDYSKHVDRLEQHSNRLIKNADEMRSRGQEYFEEWEQEDESYTNPEIREISERRRADLRAAYDEIIEASQGVSPAITAYVSDHRDIRTYLSNDLTPKGIEAISPLIPELRRDGRDLRASLARVQTSIDRAGAEMAYGGSDE